MVEGYVRHSRREACSCKTRPRFRATCLGRDWSWGDIWCCTGPSSFCWVRAARAGWELVEFEAEPSRWWVEPDWDVSRRRSSSWRSRVRRESTLARLGSRPLRLDRCRLLPVCRCLRLPCPIESVGLCSYSARLSLRPLKQQEIKLISMNFKQLNLACFLKNKSEFTSWQ